MGELLRYHRYEAVGKLGFGSSLTVWLARDSRSVHPTLLLLAPVLRPDPAVGLLVLARVLRRRRHHLHPLHAAPLHQADLAGRSPERQQQLGQGHVLRRRYPYYYRRGTGDGEYKSSGSGQRSVQLSGGDYEMHSRHHHACRPSQGLVYGTRLSPIESDEDLMSMRKEDGVSCSGTQRRDPQGYPRHHRVQRL